MAKISQIDDGVTKLFEQDFNSPLCLDIVSRNKCDTSRPIDERIRLQICRGDVVQGLNHSCSRG
jgi:hypothetical protein